MALKKFLLLIVSILCVGNSYGQLDKKTKAFLKEVLPNNIAAYQEEMDVVRDEEIQRYFSLDTINIKRTRKGRPYYQMAFNFTRDEKKYILSEFQKMRGQSWNNGLFPNAKLLAKDTINAIFSGNRGWPYFNKLYGSRLYSFSKPIFLRGDKIALFYVGYGCGNLCGEGSLAVYQQKDGYWVPVATISSWIS